MDLHPLDPTKQDKGKKLLTFHVHTRLFMKKQKILRSLFFLVEKKMGPGELVKQHIKQLNKQFKYIWRMHTLKSACSNNLCSQLFHE